MEERTFWQRHKSKIIATLLIVGLIVATILTLGVALILFLIWRHYRTEDPFVNKDANGIIIDYHKNLTDSIKFNSVGIRYKLYGNERTLTTQIENLGKILVNRDIEPERVHVNMRVSAKLPNITKIIENLLKKQEYMKKSTIIFHFPINYDSFPKEFFDYRK